MDTVEEIEVVARLIDKIKDPSQRELVLNLLKSLLELRDDNAELMERIVELEREIRTLNNANPVQGFLFAKNIVHLRKEKGDEYQHDSEEISEEGFLEGLEHTGPLEFDEKKD